MIGQFRLLPMHYIAVAVAFLAGCKTAPRPGAVERRRGDEIVVAGQFVHTGTPVVLWLDAGGYDAYRVERRFSPIDKSDWAPSSEEVPDLRNPNRFGMRRAGLTDDEIERVRGGGWDLPLLQKVVDQFVIHFDVCGVSRQCFKVLHDHRDLSVHFMLDLDGTIYVRGTIQGEELVQYDFTPEQYVALIKLTATLCKMFPRIKCDYPHDANGKLIPQKLPDEELEKYQGVLGHYHVQTNKTDPGPAFQWDTVVGGARKLLHGGMSEMADQTSKGHMRQSGPHS